MSDTDNGFEIELAEGEEFVLPPLSELPDIAIDEEFALPTSIQHTRTLARRLALQILYELDVTTHPIGETIASLLAQYERIPSHISRYVSQLVRGTQSNRVIIDKLLRGVVTEFPLEQIAVVDRCVLRMVVYEYAFLGDMPLSVIIDEGVNLTSVYGAESSLGFINSSLGRLLSDDDKLYPALDLPVPPRPKTEDDES